MSIQDDIFDVEEAVQGTDAEEAFGRISFLFGKFEEQLDELKAERIVLAKAKRILEAL
jgi:hypothetical protein